MPLAILIFGCILAASPSFAEVTDIDKQTRTAYLIADYGLATYKSKLVDSNDTGTTMSYGIGAHVGELQLVGISARRETSTFSFLLNDSSIKSFWQDIRISYRWGYAYLGAIIGSAEMLASKESEDLFDLTGNGFGGTVGFIVPVTSKALVKLDISSVTISQVVEKDKKQVTLGPRLDIDLGASVDLSKRMWDFIFGYRQRTNSISVDGTSYAELRTATYLGFQAGVDF
jgi:hypothetical protein